MGVWNTRKFSPSDFRNFEGSIFPIQDGEKYALKFTAVSALGNPDHWTGCVWFCVAAFWTFTLDNTQLDFFKRGNAFICKDQCLT